MALARVKELEIEVEVLYDWIRHFYEGHAFEDYEDYEDAQQAIWAEVGEKIAKARG